jgi:predicted outer membrane lipoprotein
MILLVLLPLAFGIINYDFLEQVDEELNRGAKWHYVGPQPPDPKAKSIPIQTIIGGTPQGEPFIVWKLK